MVSVIVENNNIQKLSIDLKMMGYKPQRILDNGIIRTKFKKCYDD